jgi:hypothetical protein
VTPERIANFKKAGGGRRGVDPKNIYGVTKEALVVFIHSLGLNLKVSKNLWEGHGVGVCGLKNRNLPDGYYIVAGTQKGNTPKGHVFVAEVAGQGVVVNIHVKDAIEGVKWLAEWLHEINWVYRVDKT